MRIDVVENGRERLRVALRTPVPLYALFAVIFVALGLACLRWLAVHARIVVEHQQLTYECTCLWLIDCGRVQSSVGGVRAVARVGHELQVQLEDGPRRLPLPRSGGEEKEDIARAIEAAVSSPDASYRHAEGSTLAGLLLGLVCIGSGLVILVAIQQVDIVADRESGMLRVTRRVLIWPTAHVREIRLGDVEAVQALPHTLRTLRHLVTSYSVRVQAGGRGSASSLPLTLLPMFTEGDAARLAQVIRDWLRTV